ncbi:HalOD1 output domain-containing protein [Haloarcula sp. NS06]|uniref:HalOD1 output domain-containing protein n=1 Tax=unclassified Haloarcula TaxID=2624677 RepID=UPI00073F0B62|nr:HalOD1 output domain-containing protein [Haloarcula sp. CBA1127]
MKRPVGPPTPIHITVKETIAALEDCHPTQLGSLDMVVDGERLDAVSDIPPGELPMLFQYCGYTITIDGTGMLYVEN